MGQEKFILHIIPEEEWKKEKDKSFYFPDSLRKEGFIHCSTRDQVLDVVHFLYKEKINHKILCINPHLVKAQIIYEDLYNMGKKFPHIYGALNLDAVEQVIDLLPNERGEFDLPEF